MYRQLLLAGTALAARHVGRAGPGAEDAKQGGSMIVTYKDDVSTLDPAIGYDWQNWSMIKSLFDGLMDYAPGTTELIPDLAESYEISDGWPDLHLQAAPGGQVPQRPRADRRRRQVVDRARRAARDPEPGPGLLRHDRRLRRGRRGRCRRSCPGSRWWTRTRIRFTLSRPDATFLHVMAINF